MFPALSKSKRNSGFGIPEFNPKFVESGSDSDFGFSLSSRLVWVWQKFSGVNMNFCISDRIDIRDSGLPKHVWGETLHMSCHIVNGVPLKHMKKHLMNYEEVINLVYNNPYK